MTLCPAARWAAAWRQHLGIGAGRKILAVNSLAEGLGGPGGGRSPARVLRTRSLSMTGSPRAWPRARASGGLAGGHQAEDDHEAGVRISSWPSSADSPAS